MKFSLETMRNKEPMLRTYIVVRGPDECWPWVRARDKDGYGRCVLGKGEEEKAHRMVYALTYRVLEDEEQVLHSCDNPPCCNPSHLFAGTPLVNVQDCTAKGRRHNQQGADNNASVITETIVRDILSLRGKYDQRYVASKFNVSRATVGLIWQGKRWTHIT
jgi:hypothetical protein